MLNNANFRYDCRNNLGNCQSIPIFDEMNQITHLKRCYNYFDEEVSKFVSSDLRAYSTIHNYDICLSETYLNHDTLSHNDNLKISGYELIRVDHPLNQKRAGICIYHKDFPLIKVNNISCLKECLNFSMSV